MLRLSPQMLIAVAGALVRQKAPAPDLDLALLESPPSREPPEEEDTAGGQAHLGDVGFVHHCGYWAHFDYRTNASSWPIPEAQTPTELAAFGLEHDILFPMPEPGDIFLQYAPQRREFGLAGIVVLLLGSGRYSPTTPYFDVYTMEADMRARGKLRRVRRRLSPSMGDRFLRWTDLDAWAGRRGIAERTMNIGKRWDA